MLIDKFLFSISDETKVVDCVDEFVKDTLTGTSVKALAKLTALRISGTIISGAIPRQIGLIIELEVLDLSFNELNGLVSGNLSLVKSYARFVWKGTKSQVGVVLICKSCTYNFPAIFYVFKVSTQAFRYRTE